MQIKLRYTALVFTLVVALLAASCVYGPKSERKSALNHLNGENYETGKTGGVDSLVVPVVKRKEKLTRIYGRVIERSGISETPIKVVKVKLVGNGPPLEAMTDINGEFQITGEIKNGSYRLQLISERYRADQSLDVSSYEVGPVLIAVDRPAGG